jgi:hypothetical protein
MTYLFRENRVCIAGITAVHLQLLEGSITLCVKAQQTLPPSLGTWGPTLWLES